MGEEETLNLRDRFAMAALQSLLSIGGSLFEGGEVLADNLARNSYKIADAMMWRRKRPRAPWPDEVKLPGAPMTRKSSMPKASKDIFSKIIEMHKQGIRNRDIAKHFGINGQSVNGVIACSERLIAPRGLQKAQPDARKV